MVGWVVSVVLEGCFLLCAIMMFFASYSLSGDSGVRRAKTMG